MLLYVVFVIALELIPEKLTGRYTRLLSSYNPEKGIIYDEGRELFHTSKIEKGDNSVIKMNKDGDFYTMKINNLYLCNSKSFLKLCKKPSLLLFEEMPFGFRIIESYSCATGGDFIKFSECDPLNKNQVFVFDLDTSLYCKEGDHPYSTEDDIDDKDRPPLTLAEKKEIMKREFAKNNITDPETQRILKKAWLSNKTWGWKWPWNKGWSWPKFKWC